MFGRAYEATTENSVSDFHFQSLNSVIYYIQDMAIFSKFNENIPFSKFPMGFNILDLIIIIHAGKYFNFIKFDLNLPVFHIRT